MPTVNYLDAVVVVATLLQGVRIWKSVDTVNYLDAVVAVATAANTVNYLDSTISS